MFTKAKKGLGKRITAFAMAVLMVLSLMPVDVNVALAADSYEYTFVVTETTEDTEGTPQSISNAIIELYTTEDAEEVINNATYTFSAVDGEAGKYKLTSDVDLKNHYYVIKAEGYKASTRTIIDELEEGITEYPVELTKKIDVTLSFSNVMAENPVQLVVGNTFRPELVFSPVLGEDVVKDTLVNYTSSLAEGSTLLTVNPTTGVVIAGDEKSDEVVTITAIFAGDDTYNRATATFQVQLVDKIPQEIVFDYSDSENTEGITVDAENNKVTYTTDFIGQEINIGISSNKETPNFIYTIKDENNEDSTAVVNQNDDGKLEIVGAGTAVITVTEVGDTTYASAEKTLTVEVEKLNSELIVDTESNDFYDPDSEAFIITNGETNFAKPNVTIKADDATETITYKILSNENGVIDAEKFAEDGRFVFTYKTGEVIIRATYPGDNKYQESYVDYKIVVNPLSLDGVEIKVNGAEPVADTWYNIEPTVTIPEEYTYCVDTEITGTSEWKAATEIYTDVLDVDDTQNEKVDQTISLYVKNVDGYIGQFTYSYKLDKVGIGVAITKDDKNLMDAILDFFSFIFGDDVKDVDKKQTFDITISKPGATEAQLKNVSYYIQEDNLITVEASLIENWTEVTDVVDTDTSDDDIDLKLDITSAGKKVIYVKVEDEAGNISYASTNGLIFDADKPIVEEIVVEGESVVTSEDDTYYTGDVTVTTKATEVNVVSGIKSIKYVITSGADVKKTEETLFTADEVKVDTTADALATEKEIEFVVNAETHDANDVKVVLIVEDNAGNITEMEKKLKISADEPVISVGNMDADTHSVSVTVTSRSDVFNEAGLVVTANAKVNKTTVDAVKDTHYTVEWTDGTNTDEKIATITFIADAAYSDVVISYTDKVNKKVLDDTTVTDFIKDEEGPTGTIQIAENVWSEVLETITFGLWSNTTVELTIAATDSIDQEPTIEYIKVAAADITTLGDLKDVTSWKNYSGAVEISEEEAFVVYAKLSDDTGKVSYISSNGYIVDMQDGDSIAITKPTTGLETYTIGDTAYECYHDDVTLTITAIDDFAGIKKMAYKIGKESELASMEATELYSYSYNSETKTATEKKTNDAAVVTKAEDTQLTEKFQDSITVSADNYNYDDVTIWVELTDNAGNVTTETTTLNILKGESSVEVSNEPDEAVNTVDGIDYYNVFRTATVTIHSREAIFNADGVVIKVLDDENQPVDEALCSVEYDADYATGDTHTFTVTFSGNAKYNFSVTYTDRTNATATYSDVFVVDGDLPEATVTVNESVWDSFLETITFGLWSSDEVLVTATAIDKTSDVTVEYVILKDVAIISKESLVDRDDWTVMPETGVKVPDSGAYVVCVRVTDTANNIEYFSSNGFIVDKDNDGDLVAAETNMAVDNGYYTSDVPVTFTVAEDGAGIKKVTYKIVKDNDVANATEVTLYEYIAVSGTENKTETAVITKDSVTNLAEGFEDTIIIDCEEFNSDNVYVTVTLTDNAGNVTTLEKFETPIAVETPQMEVTYVDDTVSVGKDVDQIPHYNAGRKAKIVITSRDDLFDINNVAITVVPTKGENLGNAYSIEWDDTAASGTHIAYVTFSENAKYDFTVNYSNKVGVSVSEYETTFVIDDVAPTASVAVDTTDWIGKLLEDITFGFWKTTVEVSANYSDVTSQIKSVEYIKTNEVSPLTEDELDELGWQRYKNAITVDADETFVIYVKVTDYAENYTIVSSKGIIVDKTEKLDITFKPATQPTNGYYNTDIPVEVTVKDMWNNMTSYSGIKEVVYWVTSDNVVSQQETVLYQFAETEPTYEELKSELVFTNDKVIIDADKNNSDNVVLHVKATDNAGNSWIEEYKVKIDITKPQISLDYETDTAKTVLNGYGLYDDVRTAKVIITERASSFDTAKATDGIDIVVKDVNGNVIANADYTISNWTHSGSGDAATHTATIQFNGDGYYTVAISYTDVAGNVNEEVVATAGENPYKFVIDRTDANVILIADAPSISHENDAHDAAIYTEDFNVVLKVDDEATTSGLQKVEYWIKNGDIETTKETLYEFDDSKAVIELEQLLSETLLVDADANNSCNVVLHVTVTDNVGRVVEKELTFDIDIDKPVMSVTFDDIEPENTVGVRDYYKNGRIATVVVNKRADHFDKEAFKAGIEITAFNSSGDTVKNAYTITEDHDGNVHTYVINFSEDANYTFNIKGYTDKAGSSCEGILSKDFTVDRLAPTGTIAAGDLEVWEQLLSAFTFGLWSPSDLDIVITSEDATSPIKSVQYYKTSTFTPLSKDKLDTVKEWVEGDEFTVSTDDIFVVYAKITDQTGHVQYISSNGIIVDETKPVFEALSPEITITPERPVNGIYDGDVKVDVGVSDPKVGVNNAYSGIREIRYEVYNMGSKTQEGTLYSFSESNPTQDKLLQSWNEQDIVVEAAKNNSNDVLVKVIATDNAGNQSVATTTLKIDITAPKIEVSYDNNNGDTTLADGVYYNANRVATIKVTERNFDASAVKVNITNTDGTVPTISGWTTTVGGGNGDSTVHTATVVYSADGDYTFAISAKDKGGNANSGVNYGASQAPTAFTIDKTVPVISVAYDNNDYANENYYKADRTATITINEHNFDASRVVATITATDNGQPVTAPTISNWSKSGDTYTATVSYTTDALYTFDIAYSDKAKNQAVDFVEQSFYVDKTMPQLSITEIVDQSANNKDKIGFVITATDTNFDVFNPVLTAVVKTETGFTTQELNIASISDITNGRVYTISNIDADGIYRITCTLVDKAGNAYTEVTLHQADGTPYVESRTSEDTLLTFSVNRDGSVFEVNDATGGVLDNYYVYDVTEDVVIVEVNANRLTEHNVTLNGEVLVEGTDYTVTTEGGNGAWMKYIYTLKKELFVEEGEYTIVVSSVDEAENSAFSDVKNAKVAFVVDRTNPVVTISGLETNGKYQTDAQTVTLIPTDDGGAVKSIVVNQVDADGKVVKTLLEELSGDALTEALEVNDGQISFDIPSGEYDYIEIVCSDCSVNKDGETNTSRILIENVLISADAFTIFWSTYQYAIIGGVAAVVAIPTGIVLFKKRIKK